MRTTSLCVLLLAAVAAAQTARPDRAWLRRRGRKSSFDADNSRGNQGSAVPEAGDFDQDRQGRRSGVCETTFPFVVNDRVVIPAGTYIQGKITHVQRGGHVKGRAEVLMHFTSMIYPSGYTVMLAGSVENTPGAEKTSMKDSEGTIRQDSEKGKDIGTVAGTATTGAVIGGLSGGGKGAGIGAGVGGVAGLAIAMLSRGSDVRLEPGTSIEMEIQRTSQWIASRVTSRRAVMIE